MPADAITMMFVAGTIIKQNELVSESALLPSCVAAAAAEIHRSGGGGSRSSGVGPIAQCYYEAFVRTEVLQVCTLVIHRRYHSAATASFGAELPY